MCQEQSQHFTHLTRARSSHGTLRTSSHLILESILHPLHSRLPKVAQVVSGELGLHKGSPSLPSAPAHYRGHCGCDPVEWDWTVVSSFDFWGQKAPVSQEFLLARVLEAS